MIELPEAANLAAQLNRTVRGKRITSVTAGHSPHKFAWFHGDPGAYADLLIGRTIGNSAGHGGLLEMETDDRRILFGDGVSLRIAPPGSATPATHQLLLEFDDSSRLAASVQMYGGLWAFEAGTFTSPYYEKAMKSPSPLTDSFSREHYDSIALASGAGKLSLKALLATEQRIPGLGNGVLQDILWNAGLHPKRKTATLTSVEHDGLYRSIRETLFEMLKSGGRDTERDLFGNAGGYVTRMSRNTSGKPCGRCGTAIVRENYMGGSVTFCPECQRPGK